MDLLTKLVSVQTMELLMLKDLAHKDAVVSDPDSRFITLEIYRRHRLGLKPLTPGVVSKNLNISLPTVIKLINNLIVLGFIIKRTNKVDKRSTDLIATNTLIVRIEDYLSTMLIGMNAIKLMRLTATEKDELKSMMSGEPNSAPLFKALSSKYLANLTALWDEK